MAPQVQPKCFQGVIDTTLQQFGSYIIQVHRQSLSVTHPITILYLVMYLDEMMAPMMMLARWYYCDGKLCNWSSRDLAPTTRGRHSPGPQPLITRSWMIMMMMTMMRMMMMMIISQFSSLVEDNVDDDADDDRDDDDDAHDNV